MTNPEKQNIKLPEYISKINIQRLIDFQNKIEKETYPETESDLHNDITNRVLDNFLSTDLLKNTVRILDIGCGKGPALKIFKAKGLNATGITLNEEDVKDCLKLGFDVYKMDQSYLQFENETFDFIWARHVLEHSFMPLYTLEEYKRVLKPEGIIYVEVPAPGTIFRHEMNPNHYSVFDKNIWLNLFTKAKLKLWHQSNIDLSIENDGQKFPDLYFNFILQKEIEKNIKSSKIYLALSKGENFGWGVCSKYLKKEMPLLHKDTYEWDFEKENDEKFNLEGKVVHALTGLEFESLSKIRGTENYGYTFFENELIELSRENAKKYEKVIAGSSWCEKKMNDYGISNTAVLLQGIDPELFYPVEEQKDESLFIIFSGGKFELRKGQDLVLAAIKILQQKYPDIILINAWYNMWPNSTKTMLNSKYINMDIDFNKPWQEIMSQIYEINKIDKNRIVTLDLVNNNELRSLYSKTDLGLFPNRCEGGTNLVLMEYMACGKPVVVSNTSGHTDVVNKNNSLLLNDLKEYKLYNGNKLWADWEEPSLEEIVSKIEFAYLNRKKINALGKQAGEDMKNLTWRQSAVDLLKIIS